MRLIIEKDDGRKVVIEKVTDLYISVMKTVDLVDRKKVLGFQVKSETISIFGGNQRELVKEVSQSLIDLQNYLDEPRQIELINKTLKENGNINTSNQ